MAHVDDLDHEPEVGDGEISAVGAVVEAAELVVETLILPSVNAMSTINAMDTTRRIAPHQGVKS